MKQISITLPVSHVGPCQPNAQLHSTDPKVFVQVAPFLHISVVHSFTSENISVISFRQVWDMISPEYLSLFTTESRWVCLLAIYNYHHIVKTINSTCACMVSYIYSQ